MPVDEDDVAAKPYAANGGGREATMLATLVDAPVDEAAETAAPDV